jgi:hypothetical protein
MILCLCVCVCVCVGPKMHCPGVHPFSLSLALVVPTFNRLTVSFTAGDFRTEKDRMRVGGGGQFYTCVIIIIILLLRRILYLGFDVFSACLLASYVTEFQDERMSTQLAPVHAPPWDRLC